MAQHRTCSDGQALHRAVMTPQAAIAAALTRVGVSKRKDQAEVIGESPTMWSRYLNGHRSPQCAKVAEWMRSARSEGYDLRLEWDADGAR